MVETNFICFAPLFLDPFPPSWNVLFSEKKKEKKYSKNFGVRENNHLPIWNQFSRVPILCPSSCPLDDAVRGVQGQKRRGRLGTPK